MVVALLCASAMEGMSAAAIFPLLSLTNNDIDEAVSTNELLQQIQSHLSLLDLELTTNLLFGVIISGLLLKSLLLFFTDRYIGYVAVRLQTSMRLELLNSIMNSRWRYFADRSAGQMVNSMSTEIMRAARSYVQAMLALSLCMTVITYALVALTVDWQATLLLLIFGTCMWLVSHRLIRMAHRAGQRQTDTYKSLSNKIADTLQSAKLFKTMAKEHLATALLTAETKSLNKALRREVLSGVALSAMQEALLVIIICGGAFIALVYMEMPLAATVTLALLLSRILVCMGKAQKQYQKMTTLQSAYWAIQKTISETKADVEHWAGQKSVEFKREVQLQEVNFSHGDKRVLTSISLTIPAKKITMLLGESGGGKTTIVDLVAGLYIPQSGQITIDGTDLNEIDIKSWRKCIGYVPQENTLLHETIFYNLTLGDESFTEKEAHEALKSAGALDFVEKLPGGLYNKPGERGMLLSGGQRQRIMLARALMQKPRLLILDEATGALDANTEQRIFRTLFELKDTVTILTVSHRASLVQFADHAYKLTSGILTPYPKTSNQHTMAARS